MTIVEELDEFIGRFVVMNDDQRLVVALWIIHTYCLDAFEQTPYLLITSPEKQCGKSRLLEVLEIVVAKPWMAVLPSEAVAYRKIDFEQPTLLLDEVDTIFSTKSADRYESLRALLNAGHRRGLKVPRCLGTGTDFQEFSVFCPKVIAGIGAVPDTIADRAIPIRLSRRRRSETVERFLRREVAGPAEAMRERLAEWAQTHGDGLLEAFPQMPEELSDRMQEGAEGLIAIADELRHGEAARDALVALLTAERLDSQERMQVRLLEDLKVIYELEKYEGETGIFSRLLIKELHRMEDRGWPDYYGRGFQLKDLTSLLKHYDIRSTTVRAGKRVQREVLKDGDKPVAKGYLRDELYEKAFSRYLDAGDPA
ncbi:MAG: DUF3631 domain-containing protein [Solirubrobacterales bacterium]